MIYKSLSWSRFPKLVDIIVNKVNESKNKYDYVISLNRGGLILGVALSHKLNAKHGVTSIESYVGNERKEKKSDLYISMIGQFKSHSRILIADDISDSGFSLKDSIEKIKKLDPDVRFIDTATLYYKPKSIVKPTYYAKEISNDTWINFAWEVDNTQKEKESCLHTQKSLVS